MLQTLHAKGFNTEVQSVDRDKHAYLAWKGAFQDHCIRLYRQDQLLKEAAQLIELENKIDHPPNGGSKDATDAAAAAFFSAIRSEETKSLSLPQGPPVVVGISPMANASPEDPFGFRFRQERLHLQIRGSGPVHRAVVNGAVVKLSPDGAVRLANDFAGGSILLE